MENLSNLQFQNRLGEIKRIHIVKELYELEEKLIASILLFLQIRKLRKRYRKPQLGFIVGIINVHVDTSQIQYTLPCDINEVDIVVVAIKNIQCSKVLMLFVKSISTCGPDSHEGIEMNM